MPPSTPSTVPPTIPPTMAGRLARYRPPIDAEMRAVVGEGQSDLFRWFRYHLGWEGADGASVEAGSKLLRPCAVLLTCELCGGDTERALPAAAAVELVHAFSLLHDDIEDGSDRRRGRPALWAMVGAPQAINAGDGVFTLARLAMHRLPAAGVEEPVALEAMRELDEACLRLVEGQYLDLLLETEDEVSAEQYLVMATGKTAALFAGSFALGALVGGAPGDTVAAFRAFGHHLGIAFQAVDDILGIWGDSAVTGKPVGDDLASRKMSYPVIAALHEGGAASAALADAYGGATAIDTGRVTALVAEAGGRDAAERLAREELAAGLEALRQAGVPAEALAVCEAFSELTVDRVA